ncbi:hypothetical protein [Clostridium perfringens]|uniref:Uncharacterized protein n=1 Tax=Clostridium perfringens TaxID=1502 RepID=A0A140GS06_CLOPF|nr:hypothetical protein [Clostridium perfringens]AMN31315.1 hypothetical protein JFP838_pA0399 [Clostridium perfringens]
MKCSVCNNDCNKNVFLVKYHDESLKLKHSICCSLKCIKEINKNDSYVNVENKREEF